MLCASEMMRGKAAQKRRRIMKRKLALIMALALTVGTVLTGCGKASDGAAQTSADSAQTSDESDVAYIQGKGTLIVGITDFAPMDYK